jgi:sulfane dehydrogenase subunit SoxC
VGRPRDGGGLSRRTWLATTSGAVAAGLVRTRFDAVDLLAQQRPPTPPASLGGTVSELGTRAPGERPRRLAGPALPSSSSRTPIHLLDGVVTPADLHFERHHGGVPAIVAGEYELLVHGMVERPTVFRLADLKRYPRVSRFAFLECAGNGGAGYDPDAPAELTPQQIDGLISTSEWIGVPLATVLREVGVRPEASWILAEGGDAVHMARSVPLDKAMDDALLAFGQNGEALRPEQGYPVRLFLPGWEGNANVKWIRRIEVTDGPTMTRDETSRYTDPLNDGRARQFSFVMDAKSVITFPAYPFALPDQGWWEIRGLAWSGRGRVTRVDVSTDGGTTWVRARLQEPVLPMCTARFRHLWRWDGSESVLMSRAVDETGYVQPTYAELVAARGPRTSYHQNNIRPWKVRSDGTLGFALGDTL